MYLTHAVFVDAGYLLAEGCKKVLGIKLERKDYHVHYRGLVSHLKKLIAAHCDENSRLLRIYWYDAAHDGNPTPEHRILATFPDIKVRLGRLRGKEQKGVDSLIVRDLMVLSLNRALQTAYLVAGDEDLREGVISAQEAGVRVVLVGVGNSRNQSSTLVWEADDYLFLKKGDLKKFFRRVNRSSDYVTISEEFIRFWLGAEGPRVINQLVYTTPNGKDVIPHDIDRNLLHYAYKCLDGDPDAGLLRTAFIEKIQAEMSKQSAAAGRDPNA